LKSLYYDSRSEKTSNFVKILLGASIIESIWVGIRDINNIQSNTTQIIIIIIIIIIFINCYWVVSRWQWLFYMYTNMKKK